MSRYKYRGRSNSSSLLEQEILEKEGELFILKFNKRIYDGKIMIPNVKPINNKNEKKEILQKAQNVVRKEK